MGLFLRVVRRAAGTGAFGCGGRGQCEVIAEQVSDAPKLVAHLKRSAAARNCQRDRAVPGVDLAIIRQDRLRTRPVEAIALLAGTQIALF